MQDVLAWYLLITMILLIITCFVFIAIETRREIKKNGIKKELKNVATVLWEMLLALLMMALFPIVIIICSVLYYLEYKKTKGEK